MSDPAFIHVLIVESNLEDASVVREALSHIQFHVQVAERLQTALEVLGREHIDVVLLELTLPDSDGFETFEKVHGAAPEHCAVVVLTRSHDSALGTRAMREGAQDHLTKAPYDASSLARSVRHAHDRKHADFARLEHARAEATRREADAHRATLQALFDSAQDAILIADDEGHYLDGNAAALSLLQRSREELTAMSVTDLSPGHVAETREAWTRFLGEGQQSGEFTVRRPDGSTRIVEFRATAHIQRDQNMSLMRDITDRKVGETERVRLLDLANCERRRAEQANRAQDEFLSVVSHELRTPLNAILGWTRMVRAGSMPPEKVARALETIERNANSQAKLIEDILDTSRITTGKLRLDLQTTDIAIVAEAAADVVRPGADAKGIRLDVLVDSDLGAAQVDAARLQQVIWNLLANAVKFSPRGGRVELGVSRENGLLEISVADTGVGIDAGFLPHVFDPFRQANSTVTRASGGLGLGLAIVKHIVELHGGSVRAESEGIGRGSLFTVRLPVTPLRAASDAGTDSPESSPVRARCTCPPELAGLHVLVVDDEEDARELMAALLARCEMRVEVAGSAADAIARLPITRPDLVISDIAMPIEDGYRFIARVRKLPPQDGGSIPAIALTAHTRLKDRTRALRAGFTNHVAKPVDPAELFAVIGAATGRRSPQ